MPCTRRCYVTHDQVEAMTLADRIVVRSAGNIEQVGPPLELYERPRNLFVARFIGSPAMNIIPVTVRETGEATTVALGDGKMVRLPIRTDAAEVGKAASFGVRPDALEVSGPDDFLFDCRSSMVEALVEVTVLLID